MQGGQLAGLDLLFAAATAAPYGNQLALFHVKLLVLVHHPLVMPVAAQGLALVLVLERGPAKGKDVPHARQDTVSRVRCKAASQEARRLRRAGAFICALNSRCTFQILRSSPVLRHSPTPMPAR